MEVVNKIENLLEHIKEYAETKVEIIALDVQEKSAEVISSLISAVIIGLLCLMFLLFLSLGAAWWISEHYNNTSIGFFYVAGFYCIVAVIIYCFKKQVKAKAVDFLIRKFNANEKD